MIGIHPVHYRLAEIVHMSTDRNGNTVIGAPELQLILPLLRQNYQLVQKLDGLKELAFVAHCLGAMSWEQEICQQIDDLEANLI